jgi:GxxExxY protein
MTFEYLELLCAEIYESLGKEHNECVYQKAMEVGLRIDGVPFEALKDCPVMFRGVQVGRGIADIVAEDMIIELKAIPKLAGNEERGQIGNYMRSLGKVRGSIVNFGQDSGKSIGALEIIRIDSQDCDSQKQE